MLLFKIAVLAFLFNFLRGQQMNCFRGGTISLEKISKNSTHLAFEIILKFRLKRSCYCSNCFELLNTTYPNSCSENDVINQNKLLGNGFGSLKLYYVDLYTSMLIFLDNLNYQGVWCISFNENDDWSYGEMRVSKELAINIETSTEMSYASFASSESTTPSKIPAGTTSRSKHESYNLNNLVLRFESYDGYNKTQGVSTLLEMKTSLTDTFNNPPVVYLLPPVKILVGGYEELKIPLIDADNDIVRCRWSDCCYIFDDDIECDKCFATILLPPYISLDSDKCVLKLKLNESQYMAQYKFALFIQIEDFRNNSIEIEALSSVPYHIEIEPYVIEKPKFVYPTKPDKACIGILLNETYHSTIAINDSLIFNYPIQPVTEIKFEPFAGLQASQIYSVGNSSLKYVNISWKPESYGLHELCFTAINSIDQVSSQSEKRCIQFTVGFQSPKVVSVKPKDGILLSDIWEINWSIFTDRMLINPKEGSISFIEKKTTKIVYKVALNRQNINENMLNFTIPFTNHLFEEKEHYYVTLDFGILTSNESCYVNSEEIKDDNFWSFYIIDTTPPKLNFSNLQSIYVNDFVLIKWTANEEATFKCNLLSGNNFSVMEITLNIECSSGSVSLVNLTRVNYRLNINATDLENNTNVYNLNFRVDKTEPILKTYFNESIKYFNKTPSFRFGCIDTETYARGFCRVEHLTYTNEWYVCDYTYEYGQYNELLLWSLIIRNPINDDYKISIKCVNEANLESVIQPEFSFRFDDKPPIIDFEQNVTSGCDARPEIIGFPKVIDDLNTTVSYNDQFENKCLIIRKWFAKDMAGNEAAKYQVIIQNISSDALNIFVKNTVIPCEFAEIYLKEGSFLQPFVVAQHKCGRKLIFHHVNLNNFTHCNSTVIRKWIISDQCVDNVEITQQIFIDTCRRDCNGHGYCNELSNCVCDGNWSGEDCEFSTCADLNYCSNNGRCIESKCLCNSGWSGDSCNVFECEKNCSFHGLCFGANQCQCIENWTGEYCETPICKMNCSNNGKCVNVNTCVCFNGYTGAQCEKFRCDQVEECQQNGVCIGPNTCRCYQNWTGATCNQAICNNLLNNCSNHGYCLTPNTCSCYNGWTSSDCSVFDCKPSCSNNGTCVAANKCECLPGWKGSTCIIPVCQDDCNNRGICISPNTCQCYSQYTGYNCSQCSNNTWGQNCNQCPKCKHGTCNRENGTCECSAENWTGQLCDTCSYTYYGTYCQPLPKILQLLPDRAMDIGGTQILVTAHNLNLNSSYLCCFGDIKSNASLLTVENVLYKLTCETPKSYPKSVLFSLVRSSDGFEIKHDFPFYFIGTCPMNDCGESDEIKRGYCRFGKCQCYLPFEGENCSRLMLAPKIYPIANLTITEHERMNIPINILSGSMPIVLSISEGPYDLKIHNNSHLQWLYVDSDKAFVKVKIQAKNVIGSDSTSFYVNVKPKYEAKLQKLNKTTFSKPEVVLLSGLLFLKNGSKLNESAEIQLIIRRTYFNDELTLILKSQSNGAFFYRYTPSNYEFGTYDVDVKHPLDSSNFQPQIIWNFLGIYVTRTQIEFNGFLNEDLKQNFTINNTNLVLLEDLKILFISNSNVFLEFQFNQKKCQTDCLLTDDFKPNTSILIIAVIKASLSLSATIPLVLATKEGVYRSLNLVVKITEKLPILYVSPNSYSFRIYPGEMHQFELSLQNKGLIDALNLSISLPTVQNGSIKINDIKIDDLKIDPGNFSLRMNEMCRIFILFRLNANLSIGNGRLNLVIFNSKSSVSVPFEYSVASSNRISLTIQVEDEYTYFASTKPLLADAFIILFDSKSNSRFIANTNSSGQITFENITEAYYEIRVSADKHLSKSFIWLAKTDHDIITVFLERTAVLVTFSVTPTQVKDEYNVMLTNTFQTFVPMPVITLEPLYVDLEILETGLVDKIMFTVRNYGLIRVNNFEMKFPKHPFINFEVPDALKLFDIEANSTTEINVKISMKQDLKIIQKTKSQNCYLVFGVYFYHCGNQVINKQVSINVGKCYSVAVIQSNNQLKPPTYSLQFSQISQTNIVESIFLPSLPIPDPSSLFCDIFDYEEEEKDDYVCKNAQNPMEIIQELSVLRKCLENVKNYKNCLKPNSIKLCSVLRHPVLITLCAAYHCYEFIKDLRDCLGPVKCFFSQIFGNSTLIPNLKTDKIKENSMNYLYYQVTGSVIAMENSQNIPLEAFGSDVWLRDFNSDLIAESIEAAQSDSSELGVYLSQNEYENILQTSFLPNYVSRDFLASLLRRINNTECFSNFGSACETNSTNYINFDKVTKYAEIYSEDMKIAKYFGYEDVYDWLEGSVFRLRKELQSANRICAKVKLLVEQKLTLTRDAFQVKLEISNGENSALTKINITLDIRSINEMIDSSSHFSVGKANLIKFTSVDGSGELEPSETGLAIWLLIAYKTAAPFVETEYSIGGTLSYSLEGETVFVPLTPDTITVRPDPSLSLIYLLEKNVQASIPFSLGLLIRNMGFGTANQMKVSSAQPQIVDNEKGLLIDFTIEKAFLNNKHVASSLSINLGDLKPNETRHVIWSLKSTLSGEFINLTAEFEDQNANGDTKLSLIDSLQYHELDRLIEIDFPQILNDSLADFMLYSDTVFSSKKVILSINHPVIESIFLNLTFISKIKIIDFIPLSYLSFEVENDVKNLSSWFYSAIELNDASFSSIDIQSCLRSDNRILPISNVWLQKNKFNEKWFLKIVDYFVFEKSNKQNYTIFFSELNEFTPSFSQEIFIFEILENNDMNISIGFVSGFDLDVGQKIGFNILSKTDLIEINSESGEVFIKVSTDYESIQELSFEIEIFDKDRLPAKWSRAKMIIKILDVNDNMPFCAENVTNFYLSFKIETNSKLLKINATDLDSGKNGLISFNLENSTSIFRLDGVTGEFEFIGPVNSLKIETLEFLIFIKDNGLPSLSNFCLLKIQVFPPNIFAPEILMNNSFAIHIAEDVSLFTVVTEFVVKDGDGPCCSSIELDSINSKIPFGLNSNMQIIVNESLDRESVDYYEFELHVSDIGIYPSNSKMTKQKILIFVDDVNDNEPELIPNNLKIQIDENINLNSLIYTFEISDRDIGANGQISDVIITPEDVPFYLKIDSENNKLMLFVKNSIDCETHNEFRFEIQIFDAGEIRLSSKANVTILINDLNDNPPIFTNQMNSINLLQNGSPLNSIVFKFTAFDEDISDKDKLIFSMPVKNEKFQLDPLSGELRIVDQLKLNESVYFEIEVTDSLFSTKIGFNVRSTDQNKYPPRFVLDNYKIKVNKSNIYPNLIETISAYDVEGNQVSFALSKIYLQSNIFRLNALTGELFQLADLVYKKHSFEVIAFDSVIQQPFTLRAFTNISVFDEEDESTSEIFSSDGTTNIDQTTMESTDSIFQTSSIKSTQVISEESTTEMTKPLTTESDFTYSYQTTDADLTIDSSVISIHTQIPTTESTKINSEQNTASFSATDSQKSTSIEDTTSAAIIELTSTCPQTSESIPFTQTFATIIHTTESVNGLITDSSIPQKSTTKRDVPNFSEGQVGAIVAGSLVLFLFVFLIFAYCGYSYFKKKNSFVLPNEDEDKMEMTKF